MLDHILWGKYILLRLKSIQSLFIHNEAMRPWKSANDFCNPVIVTYIYIYRAELGIFHTYMHVYMYDNIIYLHLPCGVFPAVAPKGIIFSRSCKEKSFVQKKRRCKHRSAKKGRFFSENIFFEQKAEI